MSKTVEELMEIAKQPLSKPNKIKGDYNSVEKFALFMELKTDENNLVPTYIVYELYSAWCFENDETFLKRNDFFTKFSNIFNKVKKSGEICYKVNGIDFDMKNISLSKREIYKQSYIKRTLKNGKKKKSKT